MDGDQALIVRVDEGGLVTLINLAQVTDVRYTRALPGSSWAGEQEATLVFTYANGAGGKMWRGAVAESLAGVVKAELSVDSAWSITDHGHGVSTFEGW